MRANAPRVVPLSPPFVDFSGLAFVRDGAVVPPALEHVRLVPHHFVARLHRAATQLVGLHTRRVGDVHRQRHRALRRSGCFPVDSQSHLLARLDDVDVHGPDVPIVVVAVHVPRVPRQQGCRAPAAELQRVHLVARRKVRQSQDEHVAQLVGRVHDEEQALAPVVMVLHRVAKRFGNLVAEPLVGGVVTSHGSSFAQQPASRGRRRVAHGGWPSRETSRRRGRSASRSSKPPLP